MLSFAACAQAATIVNNVTVTEFEEVFDYGNSRTKSGGDGVWYAQIQAGGGSDHELELGGTGSATDTAESTWVDGSDNPFIVAVDGANNLTLTFNGNGAGDGFPNPSAFNEVWVGLRLAANFTSDVLSTNSTQTDGPSLLPNLSITNANSGNPKFEGYKFHFDDRLSNIGQFSLTGNLNPDMITTALGEDWTMTFVGVYNTDLIPEPSSLALLGVAAISLSIFRRNRTRKR